MATIISAAGQIVQLAMGLGVATLIWILVFWVHNLLKKIVLRLDIQEAYRVKKYRIELEKRNIDLEEIMNEFFNLLNPSKKRKMGELDSIDTEIEGEMDEIVEKAKAKAK